MEAVLSNLPAVPDGLARAPDGNFWCGACSTPVLGVLLCLGLLLLTLLHTPAVANQLRGHTHTHIHTARLVAAC
jgi:hypothetical protein